MFSIIHISQPDKGPFPLTSFSIISSGSKRLHRPELLNKEHYKLGITLLGMEYPNLLLMMYYRLGLILSVSGFYYPALNAMINYFEFLLLQHRSLPPPPPL